MKPTFLLPVAALATSASLLAQWQQVSPITSPSARASAAAAASVPWGLVMFGGDTGGFSPSNETWAFDGSDWSLLATAASPSGRAGAKMVWDSSNGVYWMYGGLAAGWFGGPSMDELWRFDGTTWTQPAVATTTPGGTALHGMSFDPINNVTVVYGGLPDNFFPIDSDQTWEWNGSAWTQTAVTPAVNPGPLERPAMCYHSVLGKTVLFGGIDVQGFWNDDTWAYDGASHTWSLLPIAGPKPAARTGATMAYDSLRGVCVLTGGADPADMTGNTYFNDTWEFDGSTWTQVATAIAGSRLDAMSDYLPLQNRVAVFGGIHYPTFTYRGDTWEWEAGTFGGGCPGILGVPRMSTSSSPRIGAPWVTSVIDLNPSLSACIFSFGFTPVPGVDLGFVGMPGCPLYETLDVLIPSTGSGGVATWTWPSVAGTVGTVFLGQALCFDPGINPLSVTISNAVSSTIGL